MAKLILRTAVFCALLLAASPAAASAFPDVFVTETVVDGQGPFRAGDRVAGHFTVQNLGQSSVELPTSLDLLTNYANGFPTSLVDSYRLDVAHVTPGATVDVPFSVQLPRAFSGQASFQGNVEIVLGRNRTSPPTTPFTVTGGIARAEIESYTLDLSDGRQAFPFSGPTIYRDREPKGVALHVLASADVAIEVTPEVALFESTDASGTPALWTGSGAATMLAAGTTTSMVVPLPSLGYPDKVVFGTFRLVDATGVDRSGVAYFRYIPRSGEDIGRLVGVTFDGTPAAGASLSARLAVAGSPIDLSVPPTAAKFASGLVQFDVLDREGNVLASAATTSALSPAATVVPLEVSLPNADYLAYRATILSSKGHVLDRRDGTLFGDAAAPSRGSFGRYVALGTLAALIIGLVAIIAMFFKRNTPRPSIGRTLGATAVALACVAGAYAAAPAAADGDATLDFAQPVPQPHTYQCGAKIPVVVSAAYDVCTNSGADADLWVDLEGVGEVARAPHQSIGASGGHSVSSVGANAMVSMPLPVRDGVYTLTAHLVGSSGVWQYNLTQSRKFRIVGCDVCPNVPGDQASVPSGMAKDTAGNCVCPSGASFDATKGVCTNGPNGGPDLTDCPNGYKWCNGACVTEATVCAAGPGACPVPDQGEQYCVELFTRAHARTEQLTGLSLEDLEKAFGFGVREAFFGQVDDAKAGLNPRPIFGVVGRSTSVGVNASEGSAGCAGVVCAYGVQGCTDSIDQTTGKAVAECAPIGAAAGGLVPNAQIQVLPSVVGKGGHCQVSWSSFKMSSCQITGNGLSSTSLAGTFTTPALPQSAAYLLSCHGLDGNTYRDSESCSVNPDVREF